MRSLLLCLMIGLTLSGALKDLERKEPQRIFIVTPEGPSIGSIDRETGDVRIMTPNGGLLVGEQDRQGNISLHGNESSDYLEGK